MSLLSRLERRFGKFAIPNLTTALVVGQAALYVANLAPRGIALDRVQLIPSRVLDGEWWRVFTFLFSPPNEPPLFVIFYFILLHLFGSTLERHWGVFRFNVFILVGWLANVAAAFLAYAIVGAAIPDGMGPLKETLQGLYATNTFLYWSFFLAFARLYPDFILNLFFVLPIRIKWLALVMWVGYAYMLLRGPWMTRMLIVATVLNYLLFFGPEHMREFRQQHRRRSFQTKAKKTTAAPKHVCRVCGVNSDDSPKTLFRYCSKCEGQACYCPDHIRDHEHVTTAAPASPSP